MVPTPASSCRSTLAVVPALATSRRSTPAVVPALATSRRSTPAVAGTATPRRNTPAACVGTPDLQGASRTTGGLFRGCALGNAANHADIDTDIQMADLATPIMGKVLLFMECHEGAKPTMAIKHEVTPQLSPVLTKLGRSYSPI